MLISVVIPAHNRPKLLIEAAQSVAKQTYPNWEVVVVDDGSNPSVSKESLEGVLGSRIRLLRHEVPRGIPKSKNAGIKAARGEVILILDDDDLLAPNALETIHKAYTKYPEIDCVFLGVEPFGKYADGPRENRDTALNRVLAKAKLKECDGIVFFNDKIFDMLLTTVPIDFQRPAARRGTWNIVGGFEEQVLFSESSWTIQATAMCHVALINMPLSKWRIHGENFGWPSDMEATEAVKRQIDNTLSSGTKLLERFCDQQQTLRKRAQKMKKIVSTRYFEKAYFYRDKERLTGFRALVRSFVLAPELKHFRLALTYLLPASWCSRRPVSRQ